jgi:single-stranded-DNA-specific exonuclease
LQYRLYKSGNNDTFNVMKEVLKNRGIDDYRTYLNLDDSVIISYEKLDNIHEAVDCFMEHFNNKDRITVLVDSDPDGYCSASMMYNYIKQLDSEYPVDYKMHNRTKSHGLDDVIDELVIDEPHLLIIPDAGTNDIVECKTMKEKGWEIIILDHHEQDKENPYALIVNNQISKDYNNKDFCGAGVVYKFLQALDEETWNEFANTYLDLCALANISDVMDIRSFETRRIINEGLANINNKCFEAFIKAQDYSINGKVNIHNVQWYITPVLNGMIRIGSSEEKELLFRAFIETDEEFEYKTRARKDKPSGTIHESIYDRAARLSKNAKSRQDKMKDKCVEQLIEMADTIPEDDKTIVLDTSDIVDNGLTGVVAIKIAEKYRKPCILLNKFLDKKSKEIMFGGSARNVNHSPIDSFKDIVNETKSFEWGKGHAQAFGINMKLDKLNDARAELNSLLQNVVYDSTYNVDFIFQQSDITITNISDMTKFDDIIGQGIEEPMVAIEKIRLSRSQFEIFGKNENIVSFMVNDIKFIQFKCQDGNKLYEWLNNCWDETEEIELSIVGKPGINEYNGLKTYQIIIEDLNVLQIIGSEDDEEDW